MCVRLPPTFQIWIRKVISCTRLTWLRRKGGEGERGVPSLTLKACLNSFVSLTAELHGIEPLQPSPTKFSL